MPKQVRTSIASSTEIKKPIFNLHTDETCYFSCKFGFKSGICLLIVPVPVLCFSFTFSAGKLLSFFAGVEGRAYVSFNIFFIMSGGFLG